MSGALTGPAPVVAVLAVSVLVWGPGSRRGARLRTVAPAPDRIVRPRSDAPPSPFRRRVEAGLAALVVCALLGGGVPGVLAGGATALLVERLLRRAGVSADDPDRALARDLPVACDLLAVCLASGTPTGAAVTAVAGAVPGPLGDRLQEVGALYRLGASARDAWSGGPSGTQALARVLVRAGESGSTVVPALQRLADDVRAARRTDVEAAVRRAGVWVLAPLGLCFLPAFLCLGVVPLVLGIATDVFG